MNHRITSTPKRRYDSDRTQRCRVLPNGCHHRIERPYCGPGGPVWVTVRHSFPYLGMFFFRGDNMAIFHIEISFGYV